MRFHTVGEQDVIFGVVDTNIINGLHPGGGINNNNKKWPNRWVTGTPGQISAGRMLRFD